jgi:cytochrome c-type protein NapB
MRGPHRKSLVAASRLLIVLVFVAAVAGCERIGGRPGDNASAAASDVRLTSWVTRADRRAYDGAPPIIPHTPQSGLCTTCHTLSGQAVAGMGFAPANPHLETRRSGGTANCRQCHVHAASSDVFVASTFRGLPQAIRGGQRLYPGAPPVIPHPLAMRENCLACHAGPSARPEIRTSHPERANCTQCHVPRQPEAADHWPPPIKNST